MVVRNLKLRVKYRVALAPTRIYLNVIWMGNAPLYTRHCAMDVSAVAGNS